MASFTEWMEKTVAEESIVAGSRPCGEQVRPGEMVGRSLIMQRLFARVRQAAPHLRIVTIEGEAGTGKALTARTLHSLGPASDSFFVTCSASRFISGETQAVLEEVRGGTLLLTRLGELTPEQQSRFVDFLEWWEHKSARETQSFPSTTLLSVHPDRSANCQRVVTCAPTFPYRLTAIRFELPPLRAAPRRYCAFGGLVRRTSWHGSWQTVARMGPGSLARLLSHSWPGNVRELETVITNAAMECPGQWIRPIDIPPLLNPVQSPFQMPSHGDSDDDPNLDRMILRHIHQVLMRRWKQAASGAATRHQSLDVIPVAGFGKSGFLVPRHHL